MALLQISEPGQSPSPHQHRLAVGIDLGTTNSLVASVRSGSADILPDSNGARMVPSVVCYPQSGRAVVGHAAVAQAELDPVNTIASVKRLMGKGLAELIDTERRTTYRLIAGKDGVPRIQTAAGERSAVEVSADILRVLKQTGEARLGGPLVGAVITVPAYFDDAQRQATKDAARLAGLNVLRLLNEPTAAAIAYGLDQDEDGIVAIYDLGGGTFDISLLRMNQGVFEVLATAGDTALGGDDIDRCIGRWIIEQSGVTQIEDADLIQQLATVTRAAKESLSSAQSTVVTLRQPDGIEWRGELSRDQLAGMIEPLLRKTLQPCRRVLHDADVRREDIRAVVMVGGSTRIPLIRDRISEFFGRPVLTDINPDEVVAIGAAIQADILVGNKPDTEMLLLDVIPLSLGLETMGGLVEKVIPRNTTIPIARAQEFTTYKDGQTAMALHVVQGERELVHDCRSLAKFELRDIPPMVAGKARVQVLFQVDADGLLTVSAMEKGSGVLASVDVKPSYGLSDSEIERMLRDSMEHATDDAQARAIGEQQVEAKRVIEALDSALQKDGAEHLSVAERTALIALRNELEQTAVQASVSAAAIRKAIDALEAASSTFVERRMNASVRRLLAGHAFAEIERELSIDQ